MFSTSNSIIYNLKGAHPISPTAPVTSAASSPPDEPFSSQTALAPPAPSLPPTPDNALWSLLEWMLPPRPQMMTTALRVLLRNASPPRPRQDPSGSCTRLHLEMNRCFKYQSSKTVNCYRIKKNAQARRRGHLYHLGEAHSNFASFLTQS